MVSIKISTKINYSIDSDKIDLSTFSTEVDLEMEQNSSFDIEDYYSGKIHIKNVKADYQPVEIGSYKPEKSLHLEYLQGGWQKATGTCDIFIKMEQDFKLFHIPIRVGIQKVEKDIGKCELIDEMLEYVIYIKPRDIYLKFMEIYKQIKYIFEANKREKRDNEDIEIMYSNYNKSRITIQDNMIRRFQTK